MITSDVFLYLRIDLFLYAVFKVHAVLSNLVENTRFELVRLLHQHAFQACAIDH